MENDFFPYQMCTIPFQIEKYFNIDDFKNNMNCRSFM